MAPATLGIVCFRREWPGFDEAETERRGLILVDALERSGTALVSSTPAGRHAIRLCVLNPTSSEDDVRRVIEHFAEAQIAQIAQMAQYAPIAPIGPRSAGVYADPGADMVVDRDQDVLSAVPLLSRVPGRTIQAIRARAECLDIAAGDEVVRRWGSDRCFYIILSGRYHVFIDARPIRTLGPGDHFGELAARDWGGGYGYTRLATVRCAEPGQVLRLTSQDFQWLVDSEPAIQNRARQDRGRTAPKALTR